MNMPNMSEIFIVNGIGICLMVFLHLTRIKKTEKRFISDWLFDTMTWTAIAGCLVETLTFILDGKMFPGCRTLSYLLNSLCFIGTCGVGFLWCLFVDFRIFNSTRRIREKAKWLVLPLLLDIVMNLINITGCGIVFTISKDNVYKRGSMVIAPYLILFFYFIYSLYIARQAKKNSLYIKFFPVYYFVVPCMVGTIIQGSMYGITLGWASVAIAMLFVYIQTQSLDIFVDSLSGLYNRRYLDYMLGQFKSDSKIHIYGVMVDVNDFKRINDVCGHSAGDRAIRRIGQILSESTPENGIAARYAGDEFIILLQAEDEASVKKLLENVEQATENFNQSLEEPYTLSLAMGYSKFNASDSIENFLSAMDAEMYSATHRHYQQFGRDRRRNKDEARGGQRE